MEYRKATGQLAMVETDGKLAESFIFYNGVYILWGLQFTKSFFN